MIVKEKNNLKYLKYLKYLKKKNQNQNQNQRLWHSLRSCRFKSKSKVKSIDNVFAALILLKSKSFKVRTLPGCSVLTIENQKGACNQGKNWRNFYSVQSLVDTRLVNSIRAFVYAFIVELMHQRKHRHFASLRLKTMIVQARFARPSWTSGFLVL